MVARKLEKGSRSPTTLRCLILLAHLTTTSRYAIRTTEHRQHVKTRCTGSRRFVTTARRVVTSSRRWRVRYQNLGRTQHWPRNRLTTRSRHATSDEHRQHVETRCTGSRRFVTPARRVTSSRR